MAMEIAPAEDRRRNDIDAVIRRRARLGLEVSGALERARRFVPTEFWPPGEWLGGLGGASDALGDVVGAMLEQLRSEGHALKRGELVELCELTVELQRLQARVQEEDVERRLTAIRVSAPGAGGPNLAQTVVQRLRRAAVEMVDQCGFDRALVLRFYEGRMEAVATHFRAADAWAAECHDYAVHHPAPLGPGLLEWEMVRRRRPALMIDPGNDPRAWWPMVHKYETLSYASSPMLIGDEGVAVVHGDMYFTGRDVDAIDRDIVGAYAARLAHEVEQLVLINRLHGQRDAIGRMVRETEAAVAQFRACELWDPHAHESIRPRASEPRDAVDRVSEPLTRREQEVLEQLAAGATNAAIAERLFVSPHTVRTHVENILRKLHAANRAEAVAHYVREVASRDRAAF
jgi:LuxR family transcriptional regulator, regulator of acetate metabolism